MKTRSWIVPAALALLVVAFYNRLIFTPGASLAGDDLRNLFYPIWGFVTRSLRAGSLPLWNPHQYAGISLIADVEFALYYPPNWILVALPVARGLSLLIALHVWWAAWGMARLVTRWGANIWGALLAGAIYATGGWLTAHQWAGHYTFVETASWLPWVLLAVDHALAGASWRAALPAVAVVALIMLAGFPPIMAYVGLLVALYAGFRAFSSRAEALFALRQLAIVGLGAALLTAIQTLPVLEFTSFSQRGTAASDIEFAGSFPLPGAQLLMLVFPDLLGSPHLPTSYWGSPFYEELTAYAGLWGLVALAFALRTRAAAGEKSSPAYPFLIASAAAGALLSLGLHGGLYLLLLEWLPPLRLFRVPGRYQLMVTFGLAGLAALVLTRLSDASPEQRRAWLRPLWRGWLPTCGLVAGLGGIGLRVAAGRVATHAERLLVMSDSLLLGAAVLLALAGVTWLWQSPRGQRFAAPVLLMLTLADVWRVSYPLVNVQTGQPVIPMWQALAAETPPGNPAQRALALTDAFWEMNGASQLDYYTISGYESLEPERLTALTALAESPLDTPYRLLGVTHIVATRPDELLPLVESGALEPLTGGDFYVYRVTDPPPRVFLASEYEIWASDAAAQAHLSEDDFDPQRAVILPADPGCPVEAGDGDVTILDYAPNRVALQVTTSAPGLLVLTDQWYPGWQATVDGAPVEVLRADTVLRAVCVPAGAHTVIYRFRPNELLVGALISGAGWLVWLVLRVKRI